MDFIEKASTREWLQSNYERNFLTIKCGRYTYGRPNIRIGPNDQPRKLIIGEYCSIASETIIFVGRQGRHPLDTLTTYPIGMVINHNIREKVGDAAVNYKTQLHAPATNSKNLDVEIGHDVWIGVRSTIMAGVNIGTGAVVGAGSVVTKDIPPYAIVAGTPARIIRFRFDESTIKRLLASDWWTLTPDELWEICGSAISHAPVSFALEMIEAAQTEKDLVSESKSKPSNIKEYLRFFKLK